MLTDGTRSQMGYYVSELWRLKGELVFAMSRQARDEARHCFERAMTVVKEQGARLLELRAATSMASLLVNSGKVAAAAALLRPFYGQFTEGFETPDLAAAGHILATLP